MMSDRLLKESDVLKAIDKRIEELSKDPVFIRKNGIVDIMGVKKYILAIPSVERLKGIWIRKGYWSEGIGMGESYGFYYKCSNCGEQAQGGYYECGMNYCPNCGSQNQKVSE